MGQDACTLSASSFDITARAIPAATKLRCCYTGRARTVANLQTMSMRPTQRTDLSYIAAIDGAAIGGRQPRMGKPMAGYSEADRR
jgi:hypothetical protein